jgi:hypothetical protein
MTVSVRFLNNFILTVVQTVLDNDGRMSVKEKSFHIQMGDIYKLTQYHRHPDGHLDLHFADDSPLAGVAQRVEPDYCELLEPKPTSGVTARVTGCGGCGNKKKKGGSYGSYSIHQEH